MRDTNRPNNGGVACGFVEEHQEAKVGFLAHSATFHRRECARG